MIIFTVVHCCINLLGSDVAHLCVMAREALLFLALFPLFLIAQAAGISKKCYSACNNKLVCFSFELINPLPM